jgi:hypothetical protein
VARTIDTTGQWWQREYRLTTDIQVQTIGAVIDALALDRPILPASTDGW